MIVRIATEGQYELPDDARDALNEADNRVVEAVEADDEAAFAEAFGALLELVRTRGSRLGPAELRESELIVPPPELTLAEAEREFTGDGLLPD